MRAAVLTIVIAAFFSGLRADDPPAGSWQQLSELRDRFLSVEQGWGELGIDTCAHAPGQKPLPLQIGEEKFSKGLGHHAPGEIAVDLDGDYDLFEAKVGVQWQGGKVGSVVFRVIVDGAVKFESPVMRERTPAAAVSIPLAGASELRLAVTDAGDGITCDCADWASARLRRAPAGPKTSLPPRPPAVDVAPFGRLLSFDPARMDGARSSRIEEYRAEDIFLGDALFPGPGGAYRAPLARDGRSALGLEWIEKRRIRALGLEVAAGATPPALEGIEVQGWSGESLWQGSWARLEGKVEADGARLTFRPAGSAAGGFRKIRWVLPPRKEPLPVARLTAATSARWEEVGLRLEVDREAPPGSAAGGTGEIEVRDGEVLDPKPAGGAMQPGRIPFDPMTPLRLKLRAASPSAAGSEHTVLLVRLPSASFGIAVDDLRASEAVWVPASGLLAVKEPSELTPAEYRRKIAGRKTVLATVREAPEQTLEQAQAKTRNPIQDGEPMLLSLACDNDKYIAERDGTVRHGEFAMVPRFGSGKAKLVERRLEGGWLPAPRATFEEGGVRFVEHVYVVMVNGLFLPSDFPGPKACLIGIEVEVPGNHQGDALLEFEFEYSGKRIPAEIGRANGEVRVTSESGASLARLHCKGRPGTLQDGRLSLLFPPGSRSTVEVETGARDAWKAYHFPFPRKPIDDVESYWDEVLAPAMSIDTPDPLLNDLIKASQVHCLIAARNEDGGERIAAWIASMSYGPLESEAHSVIRGMDLLGHAEFARRSLDYFVKRYAPEGFLTTGYTLFGTGWHLWTLGEHVAWTGDLDWMRRVAPDVERACKWIVADRRKTMKLDASGAKPPEYGLPPPGVLADWNAFAYHYCLAAYYHAGLHEAAAALQKIGRPGAEDLLREAADLREETLRAWRWTRERMPVVPLADGTWVRGYPSRVHGPGPTAWYFPGEDGNRSWAYDVELGAHQLVPAGVLDPGAPEVTEMMDHMEDVQFLSEGWFDYPAAKSREDPFDLGGFSKVQPYYTRNLEVYSLRDDPKPFIRSYFNTLSSLLDRETLSFWEHFHRSGAWNKTHETGYFLQATRFMLVRERGDELWLAPLVPSAWLAPGKTIAVERAPTRFGPMGFRIRAEDDAMEATIDPPLREPPRAVVLRLRRPDGRPMRAVTVNGAEHKDFDAAAGTVRLTRPTGPVSLRVEYGAAR